MRLTVKERIENRIIKDSSGCWLWQASTNLKGYGYIRVAGKTKLVHRVYWSINNGPIPGKMCICHHCDVPACVNLDHLFIGTNADNMRDKTKKGRHHCNKKQQCKHGHPFNEKNTRFYIYKNSKGRCCRECDRLRSYRKRKAKKAANE